MGKLVKCIFTIITIIVMIYSGKTLWAQGKTLETTLLERIPTIVVGLPADKLSILTTNIPPIMSYTAAISFLQLLEGDVYDGYVPGYRTKVNYVNRLLKISAIGGKVPESDFILSSWDPKITKRKARKEIALYSRDILMALEEGEMEATLQAYVLILDTMVTTQEYILKNLIRFGPQESKQVLAAFYSLTEVMGLLEDMTSRDSSRNKLEEIGVECSSILADRLRTGRENETLNRHILDIGARIRRMAATYYSRLSPEERFANNRKLIWKCTERLSGLYSNLDIEGIPQGLATNWFRENEATQGGVEED